MRTKTHRLISAPMLTLLAVLFVGAKTITAAPGDLDPTFGNGGKLIDGVVRSHSGDVANGVAVQADGKIVVAGFRSLARYNPDGSLDTTFGSGGYIATCNAADVAIQIDGKIVVGCTVGSHSSADFAIVRYNPDGSLDTSFGMGGGVTTSFSAGRDELKSIAIQSDGKIVAAGSTDSIGADRWWNDLFAVARYNADGSLDTTFEGDGKVTRLIGPYHGPSHLGNGVAIQFDGKIIVVGSVYLGGANGHPVNGYGRVLIRYNVNGSLDTSFSSDGIATTPCAVLDCGDRTSSIAIQADGKIVTAGVRGGFNLARYNTDGSLDSTFGGGGSVVTSIGTTSSFAGAHSVVIRSDGKIVAAGKSYVSTTGLVDTDLAVVRYNSNGSLDTTFDGDGIVTTPVNQGGSQINAVALQPDGRIVGVGYTSPSFQGGSSSENDDFIVARYNDNGSLDTAFDSDGIVITDFSFLSLSGYFYDTAVQADGKIVAVGSGLVRYNPDGTRDTTFGGGTGMVDLLSGFSNFGGEAVAIQADGKIVVAGTESCGDAFQTFAWLARFGQDGSLDTSFDGDGMVTFGGCDGFLSFTTSVTIQSDGKIVAGGSAQVVRYNPDGSLDTTFGGGDGFVSTFNVAAIAIGSDGKIAIAGSNYNGSDLDFMTGRLNSDGSFDTTFDGDGTATTPFGPGNDLANSVVIQPDGKIVAAGTSFNGSNNDFAVVRYNANGSLDTTFNSSGIVTTPVGPGYDAASSVAIESDGKLVAAGSSSRDSGATLERDLPAYFALVRYNTNGSLDATFGGGDGKTTIDFSFSNDQATGMALDGQGRAVVVGTSDGRLAIARFLLGDLTPTCPNPIDCPEFFVRQHYRDFLGREAESAGLEDWQRVLANCPSGDLECFHQGRLTVSALFFGSPEFQLKGYFAFRFYRAAFNRLPLYSEIIADMQSLNGQIPAEVYANRAAFTNSFEQRSEFVNRFSGLSNADYVAALLNQYGLTSVRTADPLQPDDSNKITLSQTDLVARLNAALLTRAQVLRAIADSDEVFQLEFNRAFVAMQYYGYLRRTPEVDGYNAWLTYLNAHPTDFREMVRGFMDSIEYRR